MLALPVIGLGCQIDVDALAGVELELELEMLANKSVVDCWAVAGLIAVAYKGLNGSLETAGSWLGVGCALDDACLGSLEEEKIRSLVDRGEEQAPTGVSQRLC